MKNPKIPATTLSLLQKCCEALADKKAVDLKILDLTGKSSITDYFVLATGNSEPHLKALRASLESVLKEGKVGVVGVDYEPESGWLVVDAFHVMVHVFRPDMRQHYQLEALWRDAEEVPVEMILPKA